MISEFTALVHRGLMSSKLKTFLKVICIFLILSPVQSYAVINIGGSSGEAPLKAYKDNYFSLITLSRDSDDITYWNTRVGVRAPVFTLSKAEDEPSNQGLYFSYRMTGFWDIEADSGPFRDINHNPSFFWERKFEQTPFALNSESRWRFRLSGFELGIEHISNGVDNDSIGPGNTGRQRSRSIDYALFFEPEIKMSDRFTFYPRIWIPQGTSENPEIRDYWGNLWTTWAYKQHDQLSAEGAPWYLELSTRGTPWEEGSLDFRFYLPLEKLGLDSNRSRSDWHPSLFLNIFSGRGDGLLDYDQDRTWIRLGVSFTPYSR